MGDASYHGADLIDISDVAIPTSSYSYSLKTETRSPETDEEDQKISLRFATEEPVVRIAAERRQWTGECTKNSSMEKLQANLGIPQTMSSYGIDADSGEIDQLPKRRVPVFPQPKVFYVSGAVDARWGIQDKVGDRDSRLGRQLRSSDRKKREAAVVELERRITMMQGKCPSDIIEDLKIRNFQLNARIMGEYLRQPGTYDKSFQDGMGCLIDGMISEDMDGTGPDRGLIRWITDIRKIGGPSAEGMAFQLENSNYPLYVIKVSSNSEEDALAHEAVVGMAAINTLRGQVPNFVHTYGAFRCTPPIVDANGRIVSWCQSNGVTTRDNYAEIGNVGKGDDKVTYLILESIGDSRTLRELVQNLTDEEFLQVYLQLLNALNVAHKAFDYTHYDLHADNVLIQTLPYKVSIPLYSPFGLLYLETNRLARIIDFGLSHIYLQGQHFGKYGFEHVNIDPESSFPMYDAYKILLSSYFSYLSNIRYGKPYIRDSGLTDTVRQLYDFFGERKTLEQRIAERDRNPELDYFQPPMDLKHVTFDDLIEDILRRFPTYFVVEDRPKDAVATVCGDRCVNWDEFNKIIFEQTRLPDNLVDYCRAVRAVDRLAHSEYKRSLNSWLGRFDIEKAYKTERETFLRNIKGVTENLTKIKLQAVHDNTFNTTTYSQSLNELLRIRSSFSEDELWLKSAICTFNSRSRLRNINDDIVYLISETAPIFDLFKRYTSTVKYNKDTASLYGIFFNHNTIAASNILMSYDTSI